MKRGIKNFIYFLDTKNIEDLNQKIQKNFFLKDGETDDGSIEKIQLDDLKFGIYFSESCQEREKILVLKNSRKIKCGNFFINGTKKEFCTDLYFLILHQKGKDRNLVFEELIEKIMGIIKIKNIGLLKR